MDEDVFHQRVGPALKAQPKTAPLGDYVFGHSSTTQPRNLTLAMEMIKVFSAV